VATGLNFGPLLQRAPQLGYGGRLIWLWLAPFLEKSFPLPCLSIAANERIFVIAAVTWGLFVMV